MAGKADIDLYIIERIKERREAFGLSMEQLSYAVDRSYNYINNIENGPKHYNAKMINEIAKVLKCSPRDFWPEQPL